MCRGGIDMCFVLGSGRKRPDLKQYRISVLTDFHATDAHVSYGNLSKGTSGGASNLLAQEDLELVLGGWNIQSKFYSVKDPHIVICMYDDLYGVQGIDDEVRVWISQKE